MSKPTKRELQEQIDALTARIAILEARPHTIQPWRIGDVPVTPSPYTSPNDGVYPYRVTYVTGTFNPSTPYTYTINADNQCRAAA